jgi:hypothetical protein
MSAQEQVQAQEPSQQTLHNTLLVLVLTLAMTVAAALIRNHLNKFNWKKEIKQPRVLPGTRFPYSVVELQGPWDMCASRQGRVAVAARR